MVLMKGFVVKLPRWDRIYFVVFLATIFAVAAYAVVLFVPMIQFSSGSRKTLFAGGNTFAVALSLLPVLVAGFNLLVVPRRSAPGMSAKISLGFSTVLMYLIVLAGIWSIGLFFAPAAILMSAAAVGALLPRRKRTVIAKSA